MLRRFFLLPALACLCSLAQAEPKSIAFDFGSWAEGIPPKDVFVVDGAVTVATRQGRKVLEVGVDPMADALALLGPSTTHRASVSARMFATKAGRTYPRFGIGVHGQSGYRLLIVPAKKELQLLRREQVVKAIPFTWTSDTWFVMKLTADRPAADGPWTLSGKAWPADAPEPAGPLLSHEDATYRGQGRCFITATPYASTPIDFEDLKIEISD